MGTAGGRRGGVPVEDEQDGGGKSTTSRTGGARVGDELGRAREEQDRRWRIDDELGTSRGRASELGRAGEKQRRSRGEAEEEQDRRAGGGGPAAGTSEWRPLPSSPPALPSNPPTLPSCGRARAWRRGNSSRAPIWRAKIGRARAHPARLRATSAPAERAYAPPRAA